MSLYKLLRGFVEFVAGEQGLVNVASKGINVAL